MKLQHNETDAGDAELLAEIARTGLFVAAAFLGGTFMGITALGLMAVPCIVGR